VGVIPELFGNAETFSSETLFPVDGGGGVVVGVGTLQAAIPTSTSTITDIATNANMRFFIFSFYLLSHLLFDISTYTNKK
jgi:hypothetical protein